MDAAGEDLAPFLAKASARLPVLDLAPLFVPANQRRTFVALAVLHGELREAIFELSDARVTVVKCGWWAEELSGLSRGAARHPATRALAGQPGDWAELAASVLVAAAEPEPTADLEAALHALLPFAATWAGIDRRLSDSSASAEACSRLWAVHWLRQRLQYGLASADAARLPLALFARHGLRRGQLGEPAAEPLLRDAAAMLLEAQPPLSKGLPYLTRLAADADRRWLEARRFGPAASEGAALTRPWRAWRAARDAAFRDAAAKPLGT